MLVGTIMGCRLIWESIWGAVLLALCDGPEQVGQGLSVHTELRSALQNALPNALSAQAEQFAGSPEHPARFGTAPSAMVATLVVLVLAAVEEEALVNAARNAFCVPVLRGRLGSGTARARVGGLPTIDDEDGKGTACALAFAAASRSAALTVSCVSSAPCEMGGGLKGWRPYC